MNSPLSLDNMQNVKELDLKLIILCRSAKRSPSIFHEGRNTHLSNTSQGFCGEGGTCLGLPLLVIIIISLLLQYFMKSRTKGQNAI